MEPIAISLPAAVLMGLSFGAGPCNLTCLPYLGPVFLARPDGLRGSWRTVLPFSAGRMTGYACLGGIAGLLGHTLQGWLKSPLVPWLLGAATVLVGLSLLWAGRKGGPGCGSAHAPAAQPLQPLRPLSHPAAPTATACGQPGAGLPGGLFLMGAGMALTPCAPLSAVLLAASVMGSAAGGLALGLSFGLGAVAIPALVFGLAVAHLGSELREHLGRWRRGLEYAAALLLIALGVVTATGGLQP